MRGVLVLFVIFSIPALTNHGWAEEVTLGATVTGNQEQPKVLYIVPWKTPSAAQAQYQPLNSQLKSVFKHVDRQELNRQINHLKSLSKEVSD
jgi:hypothetical protein